MYKGISRRLTSEPGWGTYMLPRKATVAAISLAVGASLPACSDSLTRPEDATRADREAVHAHATIEFSARAVRTIVTPFSSADAIGRSVAMSVDTDSLIREFTRGSLAQLVVLKKAITEQERHNYRKRLTSKKGQWVYDQEVTARGKEPYSRIIDRVNDRIVMATDYDWKKRNGSWVLQGYTSTFGDPSAPIRLTVRLERDRHENRASFDTACSWEQGVYVCYPTQETVDAMSEEEFAMLVADTEGALNGVAYTFAELEADEHPIATQAEDDCCESEMYTYYGALPVGIATTLATGAGAFQLTKNVIIAALITVGVGLGAIYVYLAARAAYQRCLAKNAGVTALSECRDVTFERRRGRHGGTLGALRPATP
jgi:hypothetical protein